MAYLKLQVSRGIAITPSDTALIQEDPAFAPAANQEINGGCILYIGVTGNVKVQTASGDTLTFTGVNAGTFLPVQIVQVYNTGTTATNILGLW
tara:strand:- start:2255 stop:2533 length:279 start_codon:yes stop_codon:yes gene_type:complete